MTGFVFYKTVGFKGPDGEPASRLFAAETMFPHLCVDRVREKIFHEKTWDCFFALSRSAA
jgi:hypothetical protein